MWKPQDTGERALCHLGFSENRDVQNARKHIGVHIRNQQDAILRSLALGQEGQEENKEDNLPANKTKESVYNRKMCKAQILLSGM